MTAVNVARGPVWLQNDPMASTVVTGHVLVTGAAGHIGGEVCRLLETSRIPFIATDVAPVAAGRLVTCDLREREQVARLFGPRRVASVIHLAGVLPTAFQADPLAGAEVNLGGSFALLREAVKAGTQRFVFASSISVYGSARQGMMTEDDAAIPDEVYGASKRAIELGGEALATQGAIEFVSLRIARVVGGGLRSASSPWRGEIFDSAGPVSIPFAPDAELTIVHAEDVARMLVTLAILPAPRHRIYNTPAERWRMDQLRGTVEELRGIKVTAGGGAGGPLSDGRRFAEEFDFRITGVRDRLSAKSR